MNNMRDPDIRGRVARAWKSRFDPAKAEDMPFEVTDAVRPFVRSSS